MSGRRTGTREGSSSTSSRSSTSISARWRSPATSCAGQREPPDGPDRATGPTSVLAQIEPGPLVVDALRREAVRVALGFGGPTPGGPHPGHVGGHVVHPVHGEDGGGLVAPVQAGHGNDVVDSPPVLDVAGTEVPAEDG